MFWAKILEFFYVDADPGIFLTMDPGLDSGPDPGLKKFGSGKKHPGFWSAGSGSKRAKMIHKNRKK
jgi:hypothetical protein